MNLKDLLTPFDIRSSNHNLAVESSRTKDCRIKDVYSVGCSHHDDTFIDTKTIHLYK